MKAWLRRWGWPLAKALLAVAILAGVGREFAINLGRLDLAALTVQPAWLALSALLYVLGLAASGAVLVSPAPRLRRTTPAVADVSGVLFGSSG